MRDIYDFIRVTDQLSNDPDMYDIGHTKQRNAYRKKQNRRARRILKQELRKELRN